MPQRKSNDSQSSLFLNRSKEHIDTKIEIDGNIIYSSNLVTLLGLEIDDKLNFDSHISNLCTKAGGQLNCLYRYKKYLSSSAKKLALNSYIYSNFSYCPIAWHLSSAKSKNTTKSIKTITQQFWTNFNFQTRFINNGSKTVKNTCSWSLQNN